MKKPFQAGYPPFFLVPPFPPLPQRTVRERDGTWEKEGVDTCAISSGNRSRRRKGTGGVSGVGVVREGG